MATKSPRQAPILLDVSLTGGRGPARQAYELVNDLRMLSVPYKIISDRVFAAKLIDVGLKPDLVVDTDLTEDPERIAAEFERAVRQIDYSLMVKIGARVAGPYASRKLGKPYILVDGGLPDFLSDTNPLYDRRTFEQAEAVLLTTQFPWQYPQRFGLNNVQVCYYPVSQQTLRQIDQLRVTPKSEILAGLRNRIEGQLPKRDNDLLIDLVMTGDIFEPINRVTYGGWLTSRQYDQCAGFVRRLLADIAAASTQPFYIFTDNLVADVTSDKVQGNPNINVVTFKQWDFWTELMVSAAADITISRATNYQPYIAALCKGGSVTTPVPADGYMDEDSAGAQYQEQGLTKLIEYDDENYVAKLLEFARDKPTQRSIAQALEQNREFLEKRNLTRLVVNYWSEYAA